MIEMREQVPCQEEEKEESTATDEAGIPAIFRLVDLFARKIAQENKCAAPECGGNST